MMSTTNNAVKEGSEGDSNSNGGTAGGMTTIINHISFFLFLLAGDDNYLMGGETESAILFTICQRFTVSDMKQRF